MAIRQGSSDVSAIFLGNTEITKVYQGTVEIYSAVAPPVFEPYTINSWNMETYMPLGATKPETEPLLILFK